MSDLGKRPKTGVKNLANPLGANFWVVAFTPGDLAIRVEFEVYHIALSGPSASQFQVFIDATFYDYVPRGDINSWDPSQPMHCRPGETIFFYWNTGAGSAPTVTLFCRQPSLL